MIIKRIFVTLLPLLLAGVTGCAGHMGFTNGPSHRAGPIWSLSQNRFVSEFEFIQTGTGADLILLGERHDHPQHHLLQARVLQALVVAGQQPAVAFEMLTGEKQAAVDAHGAAFPGQITGYAEAVSWSQSGWPKWSFYAPIFEVAVHNGLPILAADIPISLQKQIHTRGYAVLPTSWTQRYRLNEPLPGPLQNNLKEEILSSHCGYANEKMVESLARFQRIRDAYLADKLLSANRQTVLIAGNGHIRNDRGVPLYVRAVAPGKQIVTLAFLEDEDDLASRVRENPDEFPFDYVWFTDAIKDQDPCVEFRKSLEKMRKHP